VVNITFAFRLAGGRDPSGPITPLRRQSDRRSRRAV